MHVEINIPPVQIKGNEIVTEKRCNNAEDQRHDESKQECKKCSMQTKTNVSRGFLFTVLQKTGWFQYSRCAEENVLEYICLQKWAILQGVSKSSWFHFQEINVKNGKKTKKISQHDFETSCNIVYFCDLFKSKFKMFSIPKLLLYKHFFNAKTKDWRLESTDDIKLLIL